MRKWLWVLGVLAAGCGSGPSAPSMPQPVQVAGLWRGDFRVTSGSGEPCVGAAFQSAVGISFPYTLTVQQSGEGLTATSTSPATGTTCQLAGTAGTSSIALKLTSCSSAAQPRFFSCVPDVFRESLVSALTVNGTIAGSSLSGTYAETHNVFVSGTSTGVGTATLTAQLALTKQ